MQKAGFLMTRLKYYILFKIAYHHKDGRFPDRLVWANSADPADPVRKVGRVSLLVFGCLWVRFPGSAHPFTSCQLLVKG